MLVTRRHTQEKRKGTTMVEFALVCIIFFLFLFGLFEYCRLLFVMHLAQNAADDAARFAVVHTGGGTMPGEPINISQSDVTNMVTTGMLGSTRYSAGMCGMQHNITGYTVTAFYVDPAGLTATPPVVQQLAGKNWNETPFGQRIAVKITGTYEPILPSLLFMSSSIPFTVVGIASSEAN